MVPCKDNTDMPIKFNAIVPNRPLTNKLIMSGEIVVQDNITGPIELKIHLTRCNVDMSYCVNYDSLSIQTLCSKFTEKQSLWAIFVESFEPQLKCPLQKNTYKVTNGTLDLTVAAQFPIEGFHWILKFEFYEGHSPADKNAGQEPIRLLMCLDSDVTVRNSRARSRKKSWTKH